MSLKLFTVLWAGETPFKNHNNLLHFWTSLYYVTSFEHLDQKSHVGSHLFIIEET